MAVELQLSSKELHQIVESTGPLSANPQFRNGTYGDAFTAITGLTIGRGLLDHAQGMYLVFDSDVEMIAWKLRWL